MPEQNRLRAVSVKFYLAGFLFTYRKNTGATRVRIDMWREDPDLGERYWISVAACAPNRRSARSVALALVAWVKSCDIGPRNDVRSQAVCESFALLCSHLAVLAPATSASVIARRSPTRSGAAHGRGDAAA